MNALEAAAAGTVPTSVEIDGEARTVVAAAWLPPNVCELSAHVLVWRDTHNGGYAVHVLIGPHNGRPAYAYNGTYGLTYADALAELVHRTGAERSGS